MISTLVLTHLFGLVLSESQYEDKSHIDVLLGAVVYARIVEGAFIKGNLNEPLATPSALCWLLSGKRRSISIYRAAHISSFHTVQNFCGEFFQVCFLQVIAPVDRLYKCRKKKCTNCLLLDQPTK